MFGPPCIAPIDTSVFFWVWLYSVKPHDNKRKKVRGFCDGSTRGGNTMVHGATYAPMPQHIDVRLQIALSALMGMYLWHTDVTNAFAEAELPEQMYYMLCDQVFKDWWKTQHPDIPFSPNDDVPFLKNLQGHPEGPRLWDIRFHVVLIVLTFKNTIHAPYLYHGIFNYEFVILLRMANDFSIACKIEETYSKICDLLDKNWQVPMSRYGMMNLFNGIDISQSRTHVSISSKTYLDTVFKNYVWNDITPTSSPMSPSNEFVCALDYVEPLEPTQRSKLDSTRFRYRAAIGELIFPMITTHPELSYPIVKLSQFTTNPATLHYDAVYGSVQYISGTRDDGLTYSPEPLTWGPVVKHKPLHSQSTYRIDEHVAKENLQTIYGYSDADWDMDIRHRSSISGMVFFLAGAVSARQTRVQPTVALSTAESEFLAAGDTGRLGLFICVMLN
jgi:hypothetical protein